MYKIISCIINFLNRINKIIWKFFCFLSKFIKIDDITQENNIANIKYRRFKVDGNNPIIEAFVNHPALKVQGLIYR